MKITELAFTLVPVTNLQKARGFYEGVLGLKPSHIFEKEGMGMIEYNIGTGTLSIGSGAPIFKPGKDGGAVALEVEDFHEAVATVRKHGAPFILEPYETPVCHMAVFADPDGNLLMFHKQKPR